VKIGRGRKLKEVNNQTHQWIKRKNPSQLTREKLDIFERHPPFKTLFWAKILSLGGYVLTPKDRSIGTNLEVQFEREKNSNLSYNGRSRSADWQITEE